MNDLMEIKKAIEGRNKAIGEEFEEMLEGETDLVNTKSNMTITVVGKLLQNFIEHLTDIAEIATNQKYYDENLKSVIETAIEKVSTTFSQIKTPEVKFEPKINVDFKLLQPIFDKIYEGQNTIAALLNKFNSNPNEELQKLIVAMVGKNNAFLDKTFEKYDYTKQLQSIAEGMNKKNDRVEKIVFNRDRSNLITDGTVVYKK